MPREAPARQAAVTAKGKPDVRNLNPRLAKDAEWQRLIDRASASEDYAPVINYLVDDLMGQMGIKEDHALVEDKEFIAVVEDCHEQPHHMINTVFDILVDRLFDESWNKTELEDVMRPDQVVGLQSIMIEGLLKKSAEAAINNKVAEYTALYTKKAQREANMKRSGASGRRDDATSVISRASTSSATGTLMSEALEGVLTSVSGSRRSDSRRPDARRGASGRDNDRPRRDDRDRPERERNERSIADVGKTKANVRDYHRGDPLLPDRSRDVKPRR